MHRCPMGECVAIDDRPVITTGLCDRHSRRSEASLGTVPAYYVRLALAMAPGRAPGGDRVTTSRTPPLAINVTVRALQEDLVHLVHDTEANFRRAKSWPHRREMGRESERLATGAAFLIRHWSVILDETDFGVGAALELHRLIGAARAVLGLDRLIHRLPAPCPTCDCLALERESGADEVRCRACGRTFSEDEYARLVLILATP